MFVLTFLKSLTFMKVHVCSCCIKFSSAITNEYIDRRKLITFYKIHPMKIIAQEIICSVYEVWHNKGLLPTANLIVKYAILNHIGVSNWAFTNHNPGIITSLARLIYQIGIMAAFDFREYVFDQVLKQVE